jgi:hypothetical protein
MKARLFCTHCLEHECCDEEHYYIEQGDSRIHVVLRKEWRAKDNDSPSVVGMKECEGTCRGEFIEKMSEQELSDKIKEFIAGGKEEWYLEFEEDGKESPSP